MWDLDFILWAEKDINGYQVGQWCDKVVLLSLSFIPVNKTHQVPSISRAP